MLTCSVKRRHCKGKKPLESEEAIEKEAANLKKTMEEEKADMQNDIETLKKWTAKLYLSCENHQSGLSQFA